VSTRPKIKAKRQSQCPAAMRGIGFALKISEQKSNLNGKTA
jgi:hypothetical protein